MRRTSRRTMRSTRWVMAAAALFVVGRAPPAMAAADGGPSLLAAVTASGGALTPAVRKAFLDRALADARRSGGDAATWDWLGRHPTLRDGLLSVAYPLPPVYLQNLATLRRELGPAIVQKYPQLVAGDGHPPHAHRRRHRRQPPTATTPTVRSRSRRPSTRACRRW